MANAAVINVGNRHSDQVSIDGRGKLPTAIINFTAAATIAPKRIVTFTSAPGQVVQSSSGTDGHIGVYIGDVVARLNDEVPVALNDIVELETGGAIIQGTALTADSQGRAVPATPGDQEFGIALEPASDAGLIIRVKIGAESSGGIPISSMGQPGGPAGPLSTPGGKIPADQLPFEVWSYQGDWNVATNDPSLTDGIGTAGDAYLVATAGTRDTGHGNIVWNVGDVAVYDGTQWDQIPHGGQFFISAGGQSAAAMLVIGTTNAQPFRILTNNLPRITVDTTGNVGIGVDTPSVPLHVAGAIAVQAGSVQTSWDPTSGSALALGTLSNHAVNIVAGGTTRATVAANGDMQMATGYTPANPRSVTTKEYVDAHPVTQLGTVTSYNGINTAGAGVPAIYASYNSAGHAANIAPTTIYAVPASGAGMYRVFAYTVMTQAATTSATLPNVGVLWTDSDSNVALSATTVTPTNAVNVIGAFGNGAIVINARAGTNIQLQTSNYASSGATAMQYAVHLRLEYLG